MEHQYDTETQQTGWGIVCPARIIPKDFRAALWPYFAPKPPRNVTLKTTVRPFAVLAETGGFFVRRHYAENVKEAEAGTCFLSEWPGPKDLQ